MKAFASIQDDGLVAAILGGGVGIIPTDTIYGIVAAATQQRAVRRLYAIKRRRRFPDTVIAADIEQLVSLGMKRRYLVAVEQFWPGAVSVVIPTGDSLEYLRDGETGLAVRIPEDDTLLVLLHQTGPLLTTSANPPSELPARKIDEAQSYFGDTVDFYVGGGDLSGRSPSTIIRVVDDAVEVLRQGAKYVSGAEQFLP